MALYLRILLHPGQPACPEGDGNIPLQLYHIVPQKVMCALEGREKERQRKGERERERKRRERREAVIFSWVHCTCT